LHIYPIRGDIQIRTFFRIVATTSIILRGVGNKKSTHEQKLGPFSALLLTIIGVVGNNEKHFSALWAKTQKNCSVFCEQPILRNATT
jgi:hypothetical protein